MQQVDFSILLSAALAPITLISGVGLLLMTMSARYIHTATRTRQLLHRQSLEGEWDAELEREIDIIFSRAALLRKAILAVVLSATFAALLIFESVAASLFGWQTEVMKPILLLVSAACIVVSTIYFVLEVNLSVRALGMSVEIARKKRPALEG